MTQQIPLGQGAFALVDDADYDPLRRFEWWLSKNGYAVGFVPVDGKFRLTYMHRLILNAGTGQLVDHINRNPLDNQRANLRLATSRQNGQNKRTSRLSHTHLKGVGWHKRRCRYHARIQFQGIRYHLGFFDDAREAALAYDAAARMLFGEFALLSTTPTKRLHDPWPFLWLSGSHGAAFSLTVPSRNLWQEHNQAAHPSW
jgi:hypothetical protein